MAENAASTDKETAGEKNRVALVTGASRGIGATIACRLALAPR